MLRETLKTKTDIDELGLNEGSILTYNPNTDYYEYKEAVDESTDSTTLKRSKLCRFSSSYIDKIGRDKFDRVIKEKTKAELETELEEAKTQIQELRQRIREPRFIHPWYGVNPFIW